MQEDSWPKNLAFQPQGAPGSALRTAEVFALHQADAPPKPIWQVLVALRTELGLMSGECGTCGPAEETYLEGLRTAVRIAENSESVPVFLKEVRRALGVTL